MQVGKEEIVLAFGMQAMPFGPTCLSAVQHRKCLRAIKDFLNWQAFKMAK
jgi:hypothetical protein